MDASLVNHYLERINARKPDSPTIEALRELHLAHLRSVPFENLSIHLGEPIVLNEDALYQKIVARRRGGFCYELNGLFASLLRALGFNVQMLSAGVMGRTGDFGPDFDHMTLRVDLEERWLADVGFGDSFDLPLRLDDENEQIRDGIGYRISQEPDGRRILWRGSDNEWRAQYRFSPSETYAFSDYSGMCEFHQTSPLSHFTRNTVCSLARREGRITLSGMRFITTHGGERLEKELSEEEYGAALSEHFGITLAKLPLLTHPEK